jgi:hypothetical protein
VITDILLSIAIRWYSHLKYTISSPAVSMVFFFAGKSDIFGSDHPRDPDEFGDCLSALKALPELRPLLPRLEGLSPHWAAMVKSWDKIEAQYNRDVETASEFPPHASGTYDLMQSILEVAK